MRQPVFVLSGPSGAGKSTIAGAMARQFPQLRFAVSATTRPRRPGEAAEAYRFMSEEAFLRMEAAGEFLETTHRGEFRYGTPLALLEEDAPLLLDLDTSGAMAIRSRFHGAVLILVLPPSSAVLKSRILARDPGIRPEELAYRLQQAEHDMACRDRFDRVVMNDCLETALREVAQVILGELNRCV